MKIIKRIDYRKLLICLIVLSVFPAVSASASIDAYAVKSFNAILNSLSSGIASWMFKYLSMYVLTPTDLSKLGSNIDFYVGYSQAMGISLVIYFSVQKLFINFIKAGMGEKTPPPSRIIGKAIINGVMVVSLHFLLDQMLWINNRIISDISNIGIQVDKFRALFTVPGNAGTDIVLLFLIMVVASLILSIIGGIRYAEIAFLYIIGPVLMAGDTATPLMGQFFRTAIGIIFTQAVQVIGIGLLMSSVTNLGGADQLFITIGFLVLLMRGSKTLREFLYSSGTGDGLGAAASQAGMMAANKLGSLKSLGSAAASSLPIPMPSMGGGRPGPSMSPRTGSFRSR